MKKTLLLIISLIIISILLFVVFTKADYNKLTESEALEIGEEKYLEFLWMVDGAFNNEKFDGDFTVNDKKLIDNSNTFTCTYKKQSDDTCVGNNFLEEFGKLFASNINYNQVYGDDTFSWIKYENGKYLFTEVNDCSISRMNLNQSMVIESISSDELIFKVIIDNKSHTSTRTKHFVLIKEDDNWKISKAYYHDICEIDYYIG